jgi:hypothetical protein
MASKTYTTVLRVAREEQLKKRMKKKQPTIVDDKPQGVIDNPVIVDAVEFYLKMKKGHRRI